MNNVGSVALRFGTLCRQDRTWIKPSDIFRGLHTERWLCTAIVGWHNSQPRPNPKRIAKLQSTAYVQIPRDFHSSTRLKTLKAYPEFDDEGLTFRQTDLTSRELSAIFGNSRPGNEILNRLMRVVHARRVDGTLDIPFDEDLQEIMDMNPDLPELALDWLRPRFPVDEDKAIEKRLSREEHPREMDHPSSLMQRGFDLGLIKPEKSLEVQELPGERTRPETDYHGPQSGAYYAALSEKEGDVFGKSQIEKMQAESAIRKAKEEEEWQARVDQSMKEAAAKAEQRSQAVTTRPDQKTDLVDGKEVRPPNLFEKWVIQHRDKATSDLTLDSPEIKNMTTIRRLAPSALFVLVACIALYLYTEIWEPPRRIDRAMPNTSLANATVFSIMWLNLLVFAAWRFPPALRLLNRYFSSVPAYPYSFSMIGNVFSHTKFTHLFGNMLMLYLFGPALHEELGRANFLALYLGAGMIGSLASLTYYTMRAAWIVAATGASGAVWGVLTAFFWRHRDSTFTLRFWPIDLSDHFWSKGYFLYALLVVLDIINARRTRKVDWMAHVGGASVGGTLAILWERSHGRPRNATKPQVLTASGTTDLEDQDAIQSRQRAELPR